ncbi:AT-hook motif nuclear-localized protein 7-like [Gastrolobium bilobum]|uniref:AT-hook motif nuclear-localized protein 7-like n=1 Tax=Gastrolobium bilobum TaxID=150636 RepID=UPI002AB11B92|nr:AT-hook motif nuclear-localized protein 7-like [Gastrolobium bilobum]
MGVAFHIIHVATGEDIGTKIMAYCQQGLRSVGILSGTGVVSTATLRRPSAPGGTVTYEGRFEMLSLSGSFLLTEREGLLHRIGGISISFAGPDGRVIGGGIVGLLIAASPVQVVVCSFPWSGSKTKKRKREGSESEVESEHQGVHNPVAVNNSIYPN